MTPFESALVTLLWATLATVLIIGFLHRPRRPIQIPEAVFGAEKTAYEKELKEKDMELFDLRQELKRAHDRMERQGGQLEDMVDRWLLSSERVVVLTNRLSTATRRLNWNHRRVRRLLAANVVPFQMRVVAA